MSDREIGFGQRCESDELTDEAWLKQIAWSDQKLSAAARSGTAKFWNAWSKKIAGRSDRRLKARRGDARSTMWPWGEARLHPAAKVWSLIDKADWPGLTRWAMKQHRTSDAWRDERTEAEVLVLADWLWRGPKVGAEVGCAVLRLVLTRALELAAYLAEPLTCKLSADRRLLVTGELPWLLGQLFAEVNGVTEFKQLGQQSLRNELIELTDGDGTPAASLLPRLPFWLASLIRSVEVGAIVGEPLLEGEPRYRFEDLLTKSVMLLDGDGRMLTAELNWQRRKARDLSPVVAMLLRGAELAGMDHLSLAAESLRYRRHLAEHGRTKKFRSQAFAVLPEERLIVTDSDLPSTQSDWASWACLRNWWQPAANTAVVVADSDEVKLNVALRGIPVIDGVWDVSVSLDGNRLTWSQPWKCTCWTSDTDMDYVELQLDLSDGLMLCRQVCLSRKDDFLVLADAVSNAGNRHVEVTTSLPLVRGVQSKSGTDTRDVRLTIGNVTARCYPIALPDDRALSTVGDFACERDMRSEPPVLRLHQRASRESLYAPIVIDWNPERNRLDAEWRTLTVTEEGQKVAHWQAAGHRLRVGNLHLIVYRSLTPSEDSRAVLGLHTNQESVIAQFHEKGYVLPIVSVET